MADWEEVKKLAADFQRTQTASAVLRLSERNCIEIVRKVLDLNLLEAFYTTDGREFITPEHLVYEIKEELYAAGSRIPITDLVPLLNVDLTHIEAKAHEAAQTSHKTIQIISGEIIGIEYIDRICGEIDEKLQSAGVITIGDVARQYVLPNETVQSMINSRLGTLIKGVPDVNDPKTIYTIECMERYKAKIAGILSALTRPIQLNHIVSRYSIPENILNATVTDLIASGRLSGVVSGGANRIYTPDIYHRLQDEWIDVYFRDNSYIEYAALSRRGISDPRSFIRSKPAFEDVIYLETCCVSPSVMLRIDAALDEASSSKDLVNLGEHLPSFFSREDTKSIVDHYMCENSNKLEQFLVLDDVIFVTHDKLQLTINELRNQIGEIAMKKKAEQDLSAGKLAAFFEKSTRDKSFADRPEVTVSKRDERKKKNQDKKESKAQFSTQGREVKTKAVKKKYKAYAKGGDSPDNSDTEQDSRVDLIFMDKKSIQNLLLKECNFRSQYSEEVSTAMAKKIFDSLQEKYAEIVKQVYVDSIINRASGKKSHADVESTINSLLSSIYMYEMGLKEIQDVELQSTLTKHLLKTLCSDIVNHIIIYLSEEDSVHLTSQEARLKLINKLNADTKEHILQLNKSLNESSLEQFYESLYKTIEKIDMMLKKFDKKRENNLLAENRQNLLLQLNETDDKDFATKLHLSVLLLFQTSMKQMVHASGKFVPQLIAYLRKHLTSEIHDKLHQCQNLVIQSMKLEKDGSEEDKKTNYETLKTLIPSIIEIASAK